MKKRSSISLILSITYTYQSRPGQAKKMNIKLPFEAEASRFIFEGFSSIKFNSLDGEGELYLTI